MCLTSLAYVGVLMDFQVGHVYVFTFDCMYGTCRHNAQQMLHTVNAHNRLKYEPTTGEYVNNRGVETRVPDFGGTSSIEYMDPDTKFIETTDYFHDMIQWFVDKGYTREKDIVGAPYDWRYSPSK